MELRKLTKQAHDSTALAEEESAKSKAAKEVIKTLTSQVGTYLPFLIRILTTVLLLPDC